MAGSGLGKVFASYCYVSASSSHRWQRTREELSPFATSTMGHQDAEEPPVPLRLQLHRPPRSSKAFYDHHARRCDRMFVLGSSLTVQPAAPLVDLALRSGARVVLVNRSKTPYDGAVSLRVWAGIGEVIPPAVQRALEERPSRS